MLLLLQQHQKEAFACPSCGGLGKWQMCADIHSNMAVALFRFSAAVFVVAVAAAFESVTCQMCIVSNI